MEHSKFDIMSNAEFYSYISCGTPFVSTKITDGQQSKALARHGATVAVIKGGLCSTLVAQPGYPKRELLVACVNLLMGNLRNYRNEQRWWKTTT